MPITDKILKISIKFLKITIVNASFFYIFPNGFHVSWETFQTLHYLMVSYNAHAFYFASKEFQVCFENFSI